MNRIQRTRSVSRRRLVAGVEGLETRALLSAGGFKAPLPAVEHHGAGTGQGPQEIARLNDVIRRSIHIAHDATGGFAQPLMVLGPMAGGGGPTGLSPSEIRSIYGFNALPENGSGQTIYIVDAYDAPNIQKDLQTFDNYYGLPNPTFTKSEPEGKPQANSGWALEISLDVEWAHAIAPNAAIDLVEAASNSNANLYGAVNWAVTNGAHIVSMSWGGGDSSGESSYDSYFNHAGVTFLASAGDTGGQVIYPSASPYVVSVGGTSLSLNGSGGLVSETAWSSGGGGVSQYEGAPGYQTSYGLSYSGRATPDVSYDADPNSGVSVYDSTRYQGHSGWWQVGGTSAGAPQWAGLVALADQGRTSPLSSDSLTSSFLYSAAATAYASNFRDITLGSNGYPAGTGYDLATGLGSPLANNLVPYLISH